MTTGDTGTHHITTASPRAPLGLPDLVGLATDEAELRLRRDGMNVLPTPPKPGLFHTLAGQFVHFFALMLWVAGALAIIAGMPELGVAIFIVIFLNGIFSFAQEYRAERAYERLHDLLPRRARVIRDGHQIEIDASQLVVGDVVVLMAGDRISADTAVINSHALSIDTSMLTGESVPRPAEQGAALFAGTFVVEGEGAAVVTATGKRTRLANIAMLTQSGRRPPTPLALELHQLVKTLAIAAVITGSVFFAVALLTGISLTSGFLFAIGVTVALVPEGLLPTVTLSLATGARRMAQRNALVRRLESVETLGSTTFICADKTGTLTLNQMMVLRAWTFLGEAQVSGVGYEPHGRVTADPPVLPDVQHLALAAARCSTGHVRLEDGQWIPEGDPMEAAIDAFARRVNVDVAANESVSPTVRRYPFDPQRRRMSVLVGDHLFVKGAPDAIFDRCRVVGGAPDALQEMAGHGLRVIAVAERLANTPDVVASANDVERDLTLLGLLGLEDPPRPGASAAVAACRAAGIRLAMITGDHPSTARAIAAEVGIVTSETRVVEGRDLPKDDRILGALMDRDGMVVSRVGPEDKLRIARVLRQRGHVVAMTGDGVNDGPALREANIGIAMGRSGTDVAREAADLVLLDDDFSTIIAAIEEGRATYTNIRRFLTYHLTDNVAELTPFVVWALSGGQFPLALGVLQILALDIGTDVLPALALGGEKPRQETLRRPPHGQHILDRLVFRRVFGVLGPIEAVFVMASFVTVLITSGWQVGLAVPSESDLLAASGAAFTAVVFGQVGNAFACRSTTERPSQLGWTTNRFLLAAIAVELLLLVGLLYIPSLAQALEHSPPPIAGWVVAVMAAPAVLLADAAHKSIRTRSGEQARLG